MAYVQNGSRFMLAVSTQPKRVLMIRGFSPLFKALVFLLGLTPLLVAADGLPPSVERPLKALGIPGSAVAIVVQEVGASRGFRFNADQAMNPASVMKLF